MGVWIHVHAFPATSAVTICNVTSPANIPWLILPNFLNVCKPLSAVSYGYCWKCCAVNYQIWHTGKICQEVIQKLLWSTLACQMQKNKATKRASLIVLISLVLGCIWSISPIRDDCLKPAPLPSASELSEEEKVEASTPFYWSLYYSLLFWRRWWHPWGRQGCSWSRMTKLASNFLCWISLSSAHILYHTECVLSQECEEDWMPWERDFTALRMRETFLTAQWMPQGD